MGFTQLLFWLHQQPEAVPSGHDGRGLGFGITPMHLRVSQYRRFEKRVSAPDRKRLLCQRKFTAWVVTLTTVDKHNLSSFSTKRAVYYLLTDPIFILTYCRAKHSEKVLNLVLFYRVKLRSCSSQVGLRSHDFRVKKTKKSRQVRYF